MTTTAPKPRADRTQPRARTFANGENETSLARRIRVPLEGYLNGRKLLMVKIRQAEGRSLEGFLKIEGGRGERLLVDFKAVTTQEGALSSLEVGGRRISLVPGSAAKRMQ